MGITSVLVKFTTFIHLRARPCVNVRLNMAGVNNSFTSSELEKEQWCLYLPGVCIHAVPVSRRAGSGNLHLEIDPFPANFTFKPLPRQDLLDLDAADDSAPPPKPSRPPPPPPRLIRMPISQSHASVIKPALKDLARLINDDKAFENTSTSVAASQMRNALTALADTCNDPEQKEVRQYLLLAVLIKYSFPAAIQY